VKSLFSIKGSRYVGGKSESSKRCEIETISAKIRLNLKALEVARFLAFRIRKFGRFLLWLTIPIRVFFADYIISLPVNPSIKSLTFRGVK